MLEKYQHKRWFDSANNRIGNCLNGLIYYCEEKEITIHTHHLEKNINGICAANGKKVIIKGDVGDYVCWQQKSGEIIIEGNAGKSVGDDMRGGIIRIDGQYESLSEDYRGGKIYHKGILVIGKE